jgi:hypothetical protein
LPIRPILTALLFLMLCSKSMAQETLRPFTTDGCSLFPDRSLIGKPDWCDCCLQHDLAYWRGGNAEARLRADKELSACVLRASGDKPLAELMYAGVRSGGGPYYFTSYRWGYGWAYGKGYAELTPEEAAQADKLERKYREEHPVLACTGKE